MPASHIWTTSTQSVANTSTTPTAVSGKVVAKITGGVQIQGGQGLGYYDIYASSSTTYINGIKPAVGSVLVAAGTGSTATTITAKVIGVGSVLTVTGPIVAMKTGGFQVEGGPGIGYLNIWTTNAVVTGPAPYVGETVQATGIGSASTSLTAVSVAQTTPVATPKPTATPGGPFTPPPTTAFMPSSWGKISPMQVFDETYNGHVTASAAAADGYRYAAVWGARTTIGTAWLTSNPKLEMAYYNALETDESPSGWGFIGHTLSWWQSHHANWILYACTAAGAQTTNPAMIPGLPNIPLDIHNPSVVDYQVRLMANYAHHIGYHALAIDEATFWQAGEGAGSGSYGCGIRQNGSWVQRYTSSTDPKWVADVIAWVKEAHSILTTDPLIAPYHLKLIVNHPADQVNSDEEAFLANVDADLNEDGYSFYGNYIKGSADYFTRAVNWTKYAQEHGVAVLTNDNWGSVTVGTPQLEWSIATYLMGNEQAEALYSAQANQYGTETYHSQYTTAVGAPCGEYYSAGDGGNPSIYYRRFANAIVVVNGGSGSYNEVAHLPTGHTYTDLLGRSVSNPLTISSNDGYVLLTSNGCD